VKGGKRERGDFCSPLKEEKEGVLSVVEQQVDSR